MLRGESKVGASSKEMGYAWGVGIAKLQLENTNLIRPYNSRITRSTAVASRLLSNLEGRSVDATRCVHPFLTSLPISWCAAWASVWDFERPG